MFYLFVFKLTIILYHTKRVGVNFQLNSIILYFYWVAKTFGWVVNFNLAQSSVYIAIGSKRHFHPSIYQTPGHTCALGMLSGNWLTIASATEFVYWLAFSIGSLYLSLCVKRLDDHGIVTMGHFYRLALSYGVLFYLGLFALITAQNRLKRQISINGGVMSSTTSPLVDGKLVINNNKLSSYHLASQAIGSIEDKFQINKNSIIRTHDSRALGAKYLNETDLSSNEDCLRWCWNTTNCNLAVYEEKVSRELVV